MGPVIGKTLDHIGKSLLPPVELSAGRPAEPSDTAGRRAALLASLLWDRRLSAVLVLAALLLIGISAAGLSVWSCPINAVFSIPCPACGMTSATLLLLRGQWSSAMQMHPFSPLLTAAVLLTCLLMIMPTPTYRGIVKKIEILERKTGVSQWMGLVFGVTWIWRLAASM